MMHIPSLKHKTKLLTIASIEEATKYYIPLKAYSTTLFPSVKPGDHVLQNQLIAEDKESEFSSKIHAPVSGFIKEIDIEQNVLILENDFKNEKLPPEAIQPEDLTLEKLIQLLAESGIAGNGGAEFPTHIKYNIQGDLKILIINGAECEPYLTADYALMRHQTNEMLQAISVLHRIFKPEEIIIGIEKQHKELQKLFEKTFRKHNDLPIRVHLLPNDYPQGGELQLIKSTTGKEIPKGAIPAQHGLLVSNVGTIWAIYNAIFKGVPHIERIITVSGNANHHLGNFKVKIGTPVQHILQSLRILENDFNVVLGGPMMGKQVVDLSTPITKGSGGVLLFKQQTKSDENCIECGYCVDACPQHLMPMQFVKGQQTEDVNLLSQYNLDHCIECGACEYICPSNLPLMQSIVLGKVELQKMMYAH